MRKPSAETLYYALTFGLRMPTWVVMAVYLVRELQMSPLELVLMGTAMEAAIFVFEVPTGVVADVCSRRLSLIVGYLGMGGAWLAVGLVHTAWLVIALWATWGLAYTFTSGAEEAWIADEAGPERARTIFLRAARYGQAGAVVGLGLQVGVGVVSLRAGVMLGGVFTLMCGAASIFLMDEHAFRRAPRGERASLAAAALAGVRYARAAPTIVLLVGVALFMGASTEGFDRLKEAHFLRDVGLPAVGHLSPVVWFGLLWLAGMVNGFVGTTLLIRRVERGGPQTISTSLFATAVLQLAAMLALALAWSTWIAIAALLTVFLARNLAGPLYTIWLNEQVTDSRLRATVFSISGQADAIGQTAGGPMIGLIGNVWGIGPALAAGALAIVPALGLYARAVAHHGREPELAELPAAAAG